MEYPTATRKNQQRTSDLLPNEQEISFDRVHDFFQRYCPWLIGGSFVVILAAVGFIAWQIQENKIIEQAHLKFASAESPEALQSIVRDFPETDVSALAAMLLADTYFQQGQWDKAGAAYQSVVQNHPASPLMPSAMIGLAALAEIRGKFNEAIKLYQDIATTFPEAFQAPQAQFAAGRLLETQGKLQESRKSYENLIASYPKSVWKNEAMVRLQQIQPLIKNASLSKVKG